MTAASWLFYQVTASAETVRHEGITQYVAWYTRVLRIIAPHTGYMTAFSTVSEL